MTAERQSPEKLELPRVKRPSWSRFVSKELTPNCRNMTRRVSDSTVERDAAVILSRLPGFNVFPLPVAPTVTSHLPPLLSINENRANHSMRGHIPISQLVTMLETNSAQTAAPSAASTSVTTSASSAIRTSTTTPPSVPAPTVPPAGDGSGSDPAPASYSSGANATTSSSGDYQGGQDAQRASSNLSSAMKSGGSGQGSNTDSKKAKSKSEAQVWADKKTKASSVVSSVEVTDVVTHDDVEALIQGKRLTKKVLKPSTFTPEAPVRQEIPTPEPEGHSYLVEVPGTAEDFRNGAYTTDGYGGTASPMGFESFTGQELGELATLYGDDVHKDVLIAPKSPLLPDDLDTTMDSARFQSEFASIVAHFPGVKLTRRIFQTTGYLRHLLGDYRRLREQIAAGESRAILNATASQRECESLKREWGFACSHWHTELTRALSKADEVQANYRVKIQELKTRYQDEIDALEHEKADLKLRVEDAETHSRLLQSRLEANTFDPWKLIDFLKEQLPGIRIAFTVFWRCSSRRKRLRQVGTQSSTSLPWTQEERPFRSI